MVKVWLNSGWEVQVDLGTGRVLQTAYRRSDLIESIHDGSFFAGDWTKLGLFLPAGLVLLLLWISGLWMWWVPFIAKRRRARRRSAATIPRPASARPAAHRSSEPRRSLVSLAYVPGAAFSGPVTGPPGRRARSSNLSPVSQLSPRNPAN